MFDTIRYFAPWMSEDRAIALVDLIIIRPRRYKAVTLGRLLNLTQEEAVAIDARTIRPIDRTDKDLHEDRKRKDQIWRAAQRAANPSGRPRGRPRSQGPKQWELAGVSKATYYRKKRETRSETKNASAILESYSYSADGISVSQNETETPGPETVTHFSVTRPVESHPTDSVDERQPQKAVRRVHTTIEATLDGEIIPPGAAVGFWPPPPLRSRSRYETAAERSVRKGEEERRYV